MSDISMGGRWGEVGGGDERPWEQSARSSGEPLRTTAPQAVLLRQEPVEEMAH